MHLKKKDGKQKSVETKETSKRHSKKEVSWVTRVELDPECAYFPPSSLGKYLKPGPNEQVMTTLRLGFDSGVTTDGSGSLATVISNSPVQAQNWLSYAATFEEHRVLAFRVEFDPYWVAGGTTAVTLAPIASVIDRTDATALTGYGLAERYPSHKKTPGQKRFHQLVTMSGIEESSFFPTSSPSANNWIKFYSSGNTASTTIGRLNVVLLIQFRGLGIN